jgi:hypothetical protein
MPNPGAGDLQVRQTCDLIALTRAARQICNPSSGVCARQSTHVPAWAVDRRSHFLFAEDDFVPCAFAAEILASFRLIVTSGSDSPKPQSSVLFSSDGLNGIMIPFPALHAIPSVLEANLAHRWAPDIYLYLYFDRHKEVLAKLPRAPLWRQLHYPVHLFEHLGVVSSFSQLATGGVSGMHAIACGASRQSNKPTPARTCSNAAPADFVDSLCTCRVGVQCGAQ